MADQNPRLAEITEQVNYELEKFGRLTGSTADSLRDAKVGVVGFSDALRKAPTQVVDAAGKMAKAMYDGQKGAAAFNSSIDSMASAAQSATTILAAIIPGGVAVKIALMALGKAIGVAADALKQVNIQGDALYKGFQDLAKSGAVASGGTTQLGEDIYKLGIGFQDLDKYLGLVNENSQDLALFGRTVFEGSADFANLRQTMKPMRAEFERLGLNAEQQNEAVMGYIRLQTRLGNAGRLQEQGYAATAEAARKYIMEQDALTKVTGISRKEQEKAMEEAMRNQRFAATLDQLVAEGRTEEAENLRVMVQASGQLGPQFQKGMTDLASGFANTEEARQVLLSTQGDALKQFDMVKQGLIKAPGEIDRAQQSIYNNVAAFNKNMRPLAAAGAYDKTFGSYAEQRKAQELKDEKFVAGMAKARAETAKQALGTDQRLAAQSNTIANQNTTQIETQRAADVAITAAAKASETASAQLAKLATSSADAATALGQVKDGASGFWDAILGYFGINTKKREITAEEADAQKKQQEKKELSDKAEAERKAAEAALKAEKEKLEASKKEAEAAKKNAAGSAALAEQRGKEAKAAEEKAKETEAKAAELEKANDAKAAEARKEAEAARKRAEDLRRYEADYRQREAAARQKEKESQAAAEEAKKKLSSGDLEKKVEATKSAEKTATRESLKAQVEAGGLSKSQRLTPQQIVEREAARRANGGKTPAAPPASTGGGATSGGTSTASPATVPVGPTTAPGGGAAPLGQSPTNPAPLPPVTGGAAPAASSGVPTAASENLLSYIRSTEHFSPTAKWDFKQWSNGYGTKAKFPTGNATDPGPRETITKEEAETRFIQAVNQAAQAVGAYGNSKKYKWGQNQVDALTSFIYNGGSGWLNQVTKDGSRKNFEIAEAMLEYNKADGKTLPGLVKRRQYESNLFKQDLQAADGGVFSGPKSGYPATLHGTEAVIPLKNGEVPVNIDNKGADQLQTDVRNLTANVIRLTQKDVMAPGGIGPTVGGWNEYTGYNMGHMTTDISTLEKIAGKLGAYDKATQTITDPKLWKEILKSGMMMNYDLGPVTTGTKGMSDIVGSESVADAIAGRIKELIDSRQDSTEAITQTRVEFADMMKTFYTDFFAKMQDEMRKENPLDSEMLAVLKDISQTNAAAAGSSEKMLRQARN